MKRYLIALAAVTGLGLMSNTASAQHVIVPHRGHAHVVPLYSAPVVISNYAVPTYSSGATFGINYASPRVSFGLGFTSPRYGYGTSYSNFGFGGVYPQPAFGGYGGHHHHHHHGHH